MYPDNNFTCQFKIIHKLPS